MDRKIKLITNCERYPNYLMDYAVNHWLRTFRPDELIFLVNNVQNFDMVAAIKEKYNIDAVRASTMDEVIGADKCVVWDYLVLADFDEHLRRDRDIVNELQETLLNNGTDVVIFLDRDECLYHPNLRELLNTFQEPVIRPRGIDVIQSGDESPLDVTRPLYEQRSHMRYYPSKSKPCITRIPIKWQVGRHYTLCNTYPHADIAGPESEYPELYLVHLDKIDIDLLYGLRIETEKRYHNNTMNHLKEIDVQRYQDWFTEAHRNGELYSDRDFLIKVNI